MIGRLWCRLTGGHYWIRTITNCRFRLECTHCDAVTVGWIDELGPPRRRRRFWQRSST